MARTVAGGRLAIPQTHDLRRYCGNYAMDGPEGNACGNGINNNEVFLMGITFDDNNSNNDFRTHVRDGYDGAVGYNELAQPLPGNRNGWRDGMLDRLAENPARDIMILPVVKKAAVPNGKYNIEVVDFVYVKVSNFTLNGKTDDTSFEVIPGTVPAEGFPSNNPGLAINSVLTVQLIQ